LFLNAKELWQSPSNTRTLLIENEIKYSRPNRRPARSASGRAGGLANMFFLEFWIFFRQKVSSQAPLHTYLGPQRILGDMHFGARNALKFSALSNNPDFFVTCDSRVAGAPVRPVQPYKRGQMGSSRMILQRPRSVCWRSRRHCILCGHPLQWVIVPAVTGL
jgi:hypothetical protein